MSPIRKLGDRHPFEIYILTACALSSFPGAVGLTEIPPSIAGELTGWQARAWVIGLMVGSILALVGLAWHRPPFPNISVTGLAFERIGLVVVGWSTVFYSMMVVTEIGWIGLILASMCMAFGLACFAQAHKIRGVLKTARRKR